MVIAMDISIEWWQTALDIRKVSHNFVAGTNFEPDTQINIQQEEDKYEDSGRTITLLCCGENSLMRKKGLFLHFSGKL